MVQRPDSEDLEGGSSAAEGQCAASERLSRLGLVLTSLCPVVALQLCVSDGVEDLMESLTVETDKSLTSQEPVSHHSIGPAAEHLQGEN